MDFSSYRAVLDGKVIIEPTLELLAISNTPLDSCPAEGYLNFYHAFIKLAGARAAWCLTNTQSKFTRFEGKKRDMVPFWFSDQRSLKQALLGFQIHSGPESGVLLPPAFRFFCDQAFRPSAFNHFQMLLPLGELTPAQMLDLIQETLTGFPLSWGYAGYGLLWNELVPNFAIENGATFAAMFRRHPGISHPDAGLVARFADSGLVDVNWVTLLGRTYMEKLGGEGKIRELLGPEIDIVPLRSGNGIAIVAGDHPELGDLAAGDELPLYRSVGRALRPLRPATLNVTQFLPVPGLDKTASRKWGERFFA